MSKNSVKNEKISNSLTQLVSAIKTSDRLTTGGSFLSSYGTISHSNNYSLLTINRIILTYLYTGNGIFQTAIEQPILDALSKGIEIESSQMSSYDIDNILEWMETPFGKDTENLTPWETIKNFYTWVRLFGGGGIIINDGGDPSEPWNLDSFNSLSNLELYDIDRWQMDFGTYFYDNGLITENWSNSDFSFVNGLKIHKSRILRSRGKRAPYYVRRQLRGWGMSEGERMIRDLNLYLKTQDVLYEILDESKIDVYKIKNFANKLLQKGGVNAISNRVSLANELKNYINALILDLDEEFEQKNMSFAGLAEVMRENRINVAAALRIPMTKLFGLSASGFNTGESDLENYNTKVESEVRTPLRPIIRKILEIGMKSNFGFVPKFNFTFPSLRILSEVDEENIKVSRQNRTLSLYDRGIIDAIEVADIGKKQGWIETEIRASKGLIDRQPNPPFSQDSISEQRKIIKD